MNKLKKILSQIPALPGIYKMLDANGQIIYIGKSKCLKKRVGSYFTQSAKQSKIERMIFLIDDIDYIVTDTHLEARLLECELIKAIRPYFNSQMKNDRRYFYIKLNNSSSSQPLSMVMEREDNTFGPFRRRQFIQSLMDDLTHLYPILQNNNSYDFDYHTLPEKMKPEDFIKNKLTLKQIFSENCHMRVLIDCLTVSMHQEASLTHYERAAIYRNLIDGLTYLSHVLYDYKNLISSDLLLKIPVGEGVKLFFISKGDIIFKKHFATLSQLKIDRFLKEGRQLKSTIKPLRDEKATIDFLNILFSEIQTMPAEWVVT